MSFQVTVILHGVPAGFKSFGKVDGQDKEVCANILQFK